MVTKSQNTGEKKKGKVKVGKLKVNKETFKNLSGAEQKEVRGGVEVISVPCSIVCNTSPFICRKF